MTSIKVALARLASTMQPDAPVVPDADIVAAPKSVEQLSSLLAEASAAGARTLIWGGGGHQGYGGRVEPDLVVLTTSLDRLLVWEPEDLTVVVEGGMPASRLEVELGEGGQTALLPEQPMTSTVGGIIAAGMSSYRRGRYGPTRDRILEVTVVTGDGRVVRGGARVVKNVTGYDLPRLFAGSFGTLGVVVGVCLKLWPLPTFTATVTIDDPDRAMASVYRPLAVLTTRSDTRIYLAGTEAEAQSQISRLGGSVEPGHQWPQPPPGAIQFSLRVPPAILTEAITRIPPTWSYVAQHGVGLIEAGAPDLLGASELRSWAESRGGGLVLAGGPPEIYEVMDPWGSQPNGLELQRRLMEAFDPGGILNPGRLPGAV